MPNPYFQFKQFTIYQDRCAMKVTTDGCLFGSSIVKEIESRRLKIESILDIGTGTGLLSLMVAQKNPNIIINAIEIDKDAAEQAMENVKASPWIDRINVIHADAKDFSFTKKYDLIISNPPFYENELKSTSSEKNIAHHSEELSLSELLTIIRQNLKPEGVFSLLLPFKRNEEIKKIFAGNELSVVKMIFVRQSVKHDYFRIILTGKLKSHQPVETGIDEISIWGDKKQYTPEFIESLKDYYLYL